jgi:hypothetical protein
MPRRVRATVAARLAAAALVLFTCSQAPAEIPLTQYHGWLLSTDGRLNAFLSVAEGNGLPDQEPAILGAGTADTADSAGGLHSTRIRNGLFTSILGFTGTKKISESFKVTARVGLWMNIAGTRTQDVAGLMDARELYGKIEGPWGSVLAGSDNDLSRGGILVDLMIAHEYGLGYPCAIRDASGIACGMVGFGAPFPWFDPGFVYSTPDLAGLQVSLGIYDPATVDNGNLSRTPFPRFEGEAKFDFNGKSHIFANGFWQVLEGTVRSVDGTTGMPVTKDLHTNAWGGQAGGMLSLGPIMLGGAASEGTGYSPLASQSQLTADSNGVLRSSRGAFGLGAVLVDALRLKMAGGLGVWHLDKNKDEVGTMSATGSPTNPQLIKENVGMTVGFYQTTEPVHFALEYFRAQSTWYPYGVPSATDPTVTAGVITPRQVVNFVNAGMTVVW